jgi:type IV secretory pathway VirB2 component (pilin)
MINEALKPDIGVVNSAIAWIEGVMLGSVATAVGVLVVAGIGFAALSARVDMRRAAHVVLGCFIVFGASRIASGIQSIAGPPDETPAPPAVVRAPPLTPPASAANSPVDAGYERYARAAVPTK